MHGDQTRRQTIRALGAAAALGVPGCLDDDSTDSDPDESPQNTSEKGYDDRPELLRVDVTAYQFGWEYEYHSGLHSDDYEVDLDGTDDDDALVVPRSEPVSLTFTSRDVPHVYGIGPLKVKGDCLPDEQTQTWFRPEETGAYEAHCYELCGRGHSNMDGDVVVAEPDTFTDWYLSQDGTEESDLYFMSDTTLV